MKIMILGASSAQLVAISKAQAMGHKVMTCSYTSDAVGHQISDEQCYASTFDKEAVLLAAKKGKIDGIMTIGTDQPVYTAAFVAEALGLSTMITSDTGLAVTNKRVMKSIFKAHHIPTTEYVLYEKEVNEAVLDGLNYPVVVKPLDSQGQRGVFFLENKEAVMQHYDHVIQWSREKEILVESYYDNDEITVSGWVINGKAYVIAITDRVTFDNKNHIGICLSHEYPSKHVQKYKNKIIDLTSKIVSAFHIEEGPIYFQYFVGDEGLKVNEIACRIGGAYEATFIPELFGIDICGMQLEASLGFAYDYEKLLSHNPFDVKRYLSVQLFFSSSCVIHQMPSEEEVKQLEGVIDAGFNYKVGDHLKGINNATNRIGYVIVTGKDRPDLAKALERLFQVLVIKDEAGHNHIIHSEVRYV